MQFARIPTTVTRPLTDHYASAVARGAILHSSLLQRGRAREDLQPASLVLSSCKNETFPASCSPSSSGWRSITTTRRWTVCSSSRTGCSWTYLAARTILISLSAERSWAWTFPPPRAGQMRPMGWDRNGKPKFGAFSITRWGPFSTSKPTKIWSICWSRRTAGLAGSRSRRRRGRGFVDSCVRIHASIGVCMQGVWT